MAKKKAWFKKGKEGVKESQKVDTEAKARRDAAGPMRFWLEYDSAAKLTFLDNPQFFIWEHTIKIGNKWRNYFTCIKEIDSCPLCEGGENPSFILVGTVINHKKWKSSDGSMHQNEKMLFVAKGRARQRLLKQIERRDNNLKFCAYEMARGTTQTEAATGEDFEFLKRLTKKALSKLIPKGENDDWLNPFDYEKIFAPLSVEDLTKLAGGETPVGAEGDKTGDDDLPFDTGGEDDDSAGKEEDEAESIDDLLG